MSRFRIWVYFLQSAFRSMKLEWKQSVLTVASVSVAGILFFGCLLVFQQWKAAFLRFAEETSVIAFLSTDSEAETKEKVLGSVCKEAFVLKCEYKSLEDAQEIFFKDYPELKSVAEQLKQDPFLPSIHVYFRQSEAQMERMKQVSSQLKAMPGIEHIEDAQKWAFLWEKSIKMMQRIFLLFGVFLAGATLFLLFSTISIVVHHRKNEIEILNLVGATHFAIALPFVVQGMLQVVLGLSGALAILYAFVAKVKHVLLSEFGNTFFTDIQMFTWEQLALFVFVSALLGALGSFVAVRGYLKQV